MKPRGRKESDWGSGWAAKFLVTESHGLGVASSRDWEERWLGPNLAGGKMEGAGLRATKEPLFPQGAEAEREDHTGPG